MQMSKNYTHICQIMQQKAATTTSNTLHPSDDVSHFAGCQRKRIRNIRATAFSLSHPLSLILHDADIERNGRKLQDKIPFAKCNVISFVVFVPTWWNVPNLISLSFRPSVVLTTTTNDRREKNTHTIQNVPYNLKAKWSAVWIPKKKKHWVKPFAFARTRLIFKNATTKPRIHLVSLPLLSEQLFSLVACYCCCVPLFAAFFSARTILCTIFSNIRLLFTLFFSVLLLPLFLVEWFFLLFFFVCLFIHTFLTLRHAVVCLLSECVFFLQFVGSNTHFGRTLCIEAPIWFLFRW